MKKIFYSLPGEGLGHAIRTLSVIEKLPKDIEIHIFTWGEAFDFFEKQNYKNLHKIEADLPFGRGKNGQISIIQTGFKFIKFCKKYKKSFKDIEALTKELNPDLIISDFEPILPRIAKKLKIKYISIDNQHKFSRCYSNDIPLKYKFYCWLMGLYTELLVPNPDVAIVSTFYHSSIKKKPDKTILVNCFMRTLMENTITSNENFILVYYKSSSGDLLLKELNKISKFIKIKVYGCPKEKRIYSNIEYSDISNEAFIKDLSKCSYLLCSAGNQLLGEAIYYGKPIFAVPEPNQAEQYLNAYFVDKTNCGVICNVNEISINKILSFINKFKTNSSSKINGVNEVVPIINSYLKD